MNIKSFFNGTVLKKDLTRFLPLWVIYLILGLLVASKCIGARYDSAAQILLNSMRLLSFVVCVYALVTAQLLFGELFSEKLCNSIHALPVRREGLFITHFTAGMIMGIGPMLLSAPIAMISMGRFWYLALLWVAGMAMLFLLFFGMAVFCMLCSGNRIAGVALYGLINIAALVALWFFDTFFMDQLYGLQMDKYLKAEFYQFCPVMRCMKEYEWVNIWHSIDCKADHHYSNACLFELESLGDVWSYLYILAAVGFCLTVVALLLYRIRGLESAGDFLAFKPLGMVFTVLSCLCLGALCCRILGGSLIGMPVGVVIGYFVCQMLLERKIKVFGVKNWLKLGILSVALALGLAGIYQISHHVTNAIPNMEDVVSVTISEQELDYYRRESIRNAGATTHTKHENNTHFGFPSPSNGYMRLVETCQIADMRQFHQMLMEEGDASKKGYTGDDVRYITVHYLMKNGTTMTRHYYTYPESPVMEQLKRYYKTPQYIFGTDSFDPIIDNLTGVYLGKTRIDNPTLLEKLKSALRMDVKKWPSRSGNDYDDRIQLIYTINGEEHEYSIYSYMYDNYSPNVGRWVAECIIHQLFTYDLDLLDVYLQKVNIDGSTTEDKWQKLLLEALYSDFQAGKLVHDTDQPARIELFFSDAYGNSHTIKLHLQLEGTQTLKVMNEYPVWYEAHLVEQYVKKEKYIANLVFKHEAEYLLPYLIGVYIDGIKKPYSSTSEQWEKKFLEALCADYQAGKLIHDINQPMRITLHFENSHGSYSLVEFHFLLEGTQTLTVIEEYLAWLELRNG